MERTRKLVQSFLGSLDKSTDYWVVLVKRRKWLKPALLILLLLLCTGGISGYYYIFRYSSDLKDDKGNLLNFSGSSHTNFKLTSYVYANNGEIIGRFFEQIRDIVKTEEIPVLLQKGFIAAEDQRFYKHPGVDPLAVTRAALGNVLRRFHIRYLKTSGASGIAQQYTRLYYGDDIQEFKVRKHALSRKVKEARIAIQVVRNLPREEILGGFLNMIYFGHGVNGVAEATRRYFDKDIRKDKLTLREVVILVSLNKSPALYCPIFHKPEEPKIDKSLSPAEIVKLKEEYDSALAKETIRVSNARERYNWVLERMADEGYISEDEHSSALFKKDEPLELDFVNVRPLKDRTYGYSNRVVKEFLMSEGRTDEELSYYGGLRIYTTIDPKIQNIASEEFEKHLALVNQGKNSKDRLNGAFAIMDIKTGNILALSGGHNFEETPYNRIFATRSPGSGFKPLVYAAAFEAGKDYFDKFCNCPFTMRGANGKPWSPQNFKDKNPQPSGYIDMARGVIWSLNLETLNLARAIGMEKVIKTANDLGVWGNPGIVRDSDGNTWFRKPGYEIRGGLDPGLPSAIGASGVNLIELANAYSVFYRNGKYIRPTLIKEIKNPYGDLIFKAEAPKEKQVLSELTSEKMLGLMRAVTKIGTSKISMKNIEQQVACKTGTSNGPKDVSIWCGTPELFIAIRLGHDDYSKVIELPEYMKKVSGDSEMLPTGGWIVGPLARKMIDRIYENRPKVKFPENVEKNLEELLNRYGN